MSLQTATLATPPAASAPPIIVAHNLGKTYRAGKLAVPALRDVNLSVQPGEFVAIVGPSGSGKSTLFHILGGLTPPTTGSVTIDGVEIARLSDAERTKLRRARIGFVFQRFNLLPTLSAMGNIEIAHEIAGLKQPLDRALLDRLSGLLGIAGRLDDIAVVMAVIEGDDLRDPRSARAANQLAAPRRPLKVAFIPRVGSAPVDPLIAAQAERTAARLRATGIFVEEVAFPVDPEKGHAVWWTIATAGLAWYLNRHWAGQTNSGTLTANALEMAEAGARVTASEYLEALQEVAAIRIQWGAFFESWDIVLTPTTAALAWAADLPHPSTIDGMPVGPRGHSIFTVWVNLIGAAAATIPVAVTDNAGGIGMQFVAPAGRDRQLLAWLQTFADQLPLSPTSIA